MTDETCRVCFEETYINNPLINPCRCTGTSKYIHTDCLQHWRDSNHSTSDVHRTHCMECNYAYVIEVIPQKISCCYIVAFTIVNNNLYLITIVCASTTILINNFACPTFYLWDNLSNHTMSNPFIEKVYVINCYNITPGIIISLYSYMHTTNLNNHSLDGTHYI